MLDSLEWLWWKEGLFEYGYASAASSHQHGCLNLNFGNVVDSLLRNTDIVPQMKIQRVVWCGQGNEKCWSCSLLKWASTNTKASHQG